MADVAPGEKSHSGNSPVLLKAVLTSCLLACAGSLSAGLDAEKIVATGVKVFERSKCQGFDFIKFEYEGCEAWLAEPTTPAAGNPWVWCMEWPAAFQDRMGVKALLSAGFRWVAFNPAWAERMYVKVTTAGNQNDEMLAKRRRCQDFLVKTLGLEAKCGLIGMSWGGFYSVRYASEYPSCVKAIFLDAPLLDFSTLKGFHDKGWEGLVNYWPMISKDYIGKDDPMQSVAPARAEKIAKAGMPVLCVYGAADNEVPPEANCLRFAEAYERAGGHLKLWRDNRRGHHPHGLEPNEQSVIVNFFSDWKRNEKN